MASGTNCFFLMSVFKGVCFIGRKLSGERYKRLALGIAYKQDDAVHKYIKKIMALPFLSHEHIIPMFETLKGFATSSL